MDLTGNMDPSVDEITAERPGPDFMEGTNVWLWDAQGRVALPRVAVDSIGAWWSDKHMFSLNLALPDGRVLMLRGSAPPVPALDSQGRPRIRGAGPMRFECLEPFRRWRVSFDGLAGQTNSEKQIENRFGGPQAIPEPSVPVRFEIEHTMSGHPWVYGSFEPDGATLNTEHRIEQLCTAAGEVVIDGEAIPFEGGGLRIHRKGNATRSDYSDWLGHVWMSAQFPSGRAFGIDNFHPRPDGSLRFHEGWIRDNDELLSAKFVVAPWKTDWIARGEDVSFILRSRNGDHRITATTVFTTVSPMMQAPGGGTPFPAVQQGIVRYTWGNEQAYGMIERSSPREQPPA